MPKSVLTYEQNLENEKKILKKIILNRSKNISTKEVYQVYNNSNENNSSSSYKENGISFNQKTDKSERTNNRHGTQSKYIINIHIY